MTQRRLIAALAIAIMGLLISVGAAWGQPAEPVTDDAVNAIAHELYCPVCPNERLDACQTAACVTWRGEIREQLEQGRTRDQIVAYFVDRYGQRAVGIPTDPFLRTLSLAMPYVFAAIALIVALGSLFYYWRRPPTAIVRGVEQPTITPPPPDTDEADYRRHIERDLNR